MRKRKWNDRMDLEDLGIPRSTLRDLDVFESARESLDVMESARWGLDIADSTIDHNADVVGNNDMVDFERASANFAAADVPISGFTDALNNEIAKMRAPLDLAKSSLLGTGLGGFEKPQLRSFAIPRAIADASHARSLFDSVSDITRGASSLSSSILKPSDVFGGIAKPPTQNLLSEAFGLEPGWSAAKTISQLSGAGRLESDIAPGGWQSSLLSQVGHTSFPPNTLTEIFGAANTIAGWNAAVPPNDHWMFDLARRADAFGTSVIGFVERMQPTFDAIGSFVSGIARAFEGFDWEAIERAARVLEARRPRTKIGFAALNAYDELHMGDPRVADRFLVDYLDIEPNEDRREALWRVLRWAFERTVTYPARWIVLDDERAAKYLRTAVYKEAKRVRRDVEMPDRIWWTERDPKTKKKVELPRPVQPEHDVEFMVGGSGNPADIVTNVMDDRAQALALLYEQGSAEDKEFVRLFLTGHSQADIARVYGWTKVQRFTRKAERWRIKQNPPSDG